MSDETTAEISVSVKADSTPQYTFTFEKGDGEFAFSREEAIESAKHSASVSLTEGSEFYEWNVLKVVDAGTTVVDHTDDESYNLTIPFSPLSDAGPNENMKIANHTIQIGDGISTGEEFRLVVGMQGDTLIYYVPDDERFGYSIVEVLEMELGKDEGDYTHQPRQTESAPYE